MAINIQHIHSSHVEVTFDQRFRFCTCGTMDEIAKLVCETLIKHNFSNADVCSTETGEVLMVIEQN